MVLVWSSRTQEQGESEEFVFNGIICDLLQILKFSLEGSLWPCSVILSVACTGQCCSCGKIVLKRTDFLYIIEIGCI